MKLSWRESSNPVNLPTSMPALPARERAPSHDPSPTNNTAVGIIGTCLSYEAER